MHHPTGDWAARYGLVDPGPIADELLTLAPTELSDRFRAVQQLGRQIDQAMASADAALAVLDSGWSDPRAREALGALAAAGRYGAGVLATQSAAALRVASIMDTAQAAARAAYAWADDVIIRHDLLRAEPPLDALLHAATGEDPLRVARVAVVTELAEGMTRAQRKVATAVATLDAALIDDPRQRLREFRPPVAVPATQPGSPVLIDRDNRAAMMADLNGSNPYRARFAAGVLAALDHATATAPSGTVVQLLVYDPRHPENQGGAAIGIGDVAGADDVAVVVPGVGNSPAEMAGSLDAADRVRAAAQLADPSASVAVVAWLGYDIPLSWPEDLPVGPAHTLIDTFMALNGTEALDGGARLALFAAGLRARMAPSARLTLVGHSYGSVVVSEAATLTSGIDDIVLLGSPGAGPGVRDVRDYVHLGPGHVFALSFDDDPITTSVTDVLTAIVAPPLTMLSGSTFGHDPAAEGFGAQVIDAPSDVPSVQLGGGLWLPSQLPVDLLMTAVVNSRQHPLSNYLSGAAGLAVGAVVVGRYTAVKTRNGR